ncbi:unnamed protein product [Rhizophagus irregularis]|nr:unnamed protein product [Rhizophagus irregularis]
MFSECSCVFVTVTYLTYYIISYHTTLSYTREYIVYQATPEFTNMDNTENTEFSADDFTSLFDSNGLFKDKLEGFNENQKKLRSLNEKAKDVQEENVKLKNEVKAWVNRKGQIKLAQSNIDNSYPSEVPPKGKEDDKTYQERYAIAKEFISGWRTCIDEFEDYQKKCDEFGKLFEETTQKNKDNINKTLSKLSKLSKLSLPGGSFHPLIYRLFKHSYHTKSQGCCNLGFFSKLNTMYQIENLFIEIGVNLNIYQDDITATEDKIKEYRELLDKTVLKLNRIRMARTPAYSNQAQQCFVCNRPYVFLKWCKFCDIEQFKKQFSNWGSGNPEFDKIIHDSQLSIKYPNGFIQWIPYEKFVNVEFVGRGAYANVYKANWVEGLGTWDYALGKRVRYPNTPVALKELKNSIHVGKEFLEEVTAYIKSSSSTVLRCYDPDKRPTTKDLYQKILFWLNEFNKTPLPDTIQQFITNKQKSFDEVHDSNVEYASQSVKTQTIKDPIIEKLAAKIKKGTNSDNDDKKYEDEADEWNTIHINDYQNWLYELDIMRDFSEGKIASIVTNEIPQLNYESPPPPPPPTLPTPPTPSTGENTTTGESTPGIQITHSLEAFTESLK